MSVMWDFGGFSPALHFTGEEAANRLLRSLCVLNKMVVNAECLPIIFQSLAESINALAKILQETINPSCHSAMATFLHNLLKVGHRLLPIDT